MFAGVDHVGAKADDAFQSQLQVVDVRLAARQTARKGKYGRVSRGRRTRKMEDFRGTRTMEETREEGGQ